MTREEAIRELKILKEEYWDDDGYGHETKQYDDTMLALDIAIKVLEQQPCEDAVSRQAIIDEMEKRHAEGDCITKGFVKNMPPVTPQPKTGHWIDTNHHQYYNDGDIETTELRCSCCNEEVEWDIALSHKPYYCENCGADMRINEENDV
jgi:hypothetical protein